MVDQFEAEMCLHTAPTDNLVLTIIDDRSDSREVPRQTLWQPPGPGLQVGAKPRGRAMLAVGID